MIEKYHHKWYHVGKILPQTGLLLLMLEKNLQTLNEIIVGSARAETAKLLSHLKRERHVLRIAPRIYTTNLVDSAENIVRRNLWAILCRLWPGARLCHRTAFEYAPHEGHVFLAYKYTRKIKLPGLIVHFLSTPDSLPSDYAFMEGLKVSSQARAFLENLEPNRTQGGIAKCLGAEKIEERLEAVFAAGGESALNRLRDEARAVASAIGQSIGFARLDKMIGAFLSTKPADVLKSRVAIARVTGEPFDSSRVELFGKLLERLASTEFPDMPEINTSDQAYATFAFFESYFSNYIEGTEFEIEEARKIVETGVSLPMRDADSHDILGTYAIASDRNEMARRATTVEEFLDILRDRHRIMLAGRPSSAPGQFKTRDNRAGNTHFVSFDRVCGTLKRGFEMSPAIRHPVAKAVFILIVTSEVHPFADGNGRLSRIMMNSELTAAGQSKIIVPTVFRPDYIGALRCLSRRGDPDTFVRAMIRLRDFSRVLYGGDFEVMRRQLEEANAFADEEGAKLELRYV